MSLKDALQKAGFNSSKTQNDRVKVADKYKKKSEKHQEHRNFCEVCELIQPDVERYRHRVPTVDAQWICLNCADKNMIPDDTRVTNQSDFARAGNFMRYFGATKDFSKEQTQRKPRPHDRDKNGNANSNNNQRRQGSARNNSNKKNFNR